MNERVEELAGQAFQYASDHADDSGKGSLGVFAEKFAELLEKELEAKHFSAGYIEGRSDGTIETVQECIQLADQYGSGGAGSEFDVGYCSCANTLSDEFKKRFGVEG